MMLSWPLHNGMLVVLGKACQLYVQTSAAAASPVLSKLL